MSTNRKKRKTGVVCYTRRYRGQPGLWETDCGAFILPLTDKCPVCGKHPRLLDTFDSADEEIAHLRHACDFYMTQILRSYRAADAWMTLAEQRKSEVHELQEACRKHRQARRTYAMQVAAAREHVARLKRLLKAEKDKAEFWRNVRIIQSTVDEE